MYSIISIQDIREKQFYFFLIPILVISNFFITVFSFDLDYTLELMKQNFVFVVLLVLVLVLYYFMKNAELHSLKDKVGMGDLLFLTTLIPLLAPTFLKIFILTISITGVLVLFLYSKKVKENIQIPLAGILSTILVFMLVLDVIKVINPLCFEIEF